MKTLRFFGMMLTAVMMAFSMVACGSDDGDGGASYTGQWAYDDGSNEVIVLNLSTNSGTIVYYEITGQHSVNKESIAFNLSVSGNNFTITPKGIDEIEAFSGTWSVSGNTLTIKASGQSSSITFTRPSAELKADISDWDKYANNVQ